MSVCQSCGGIIGRDCFNPQECAEITHAMNQQQAIECGRYEAMRETASLMERLDKLEKHWRNMASHYVAGDIRGLLTSELADAMRAAIDRKGRA